MKALLLLAALLAPHADDADTLYAQIEAIKPPAFDQEKYNKDKETYIKEYETAVRKQDEERNRLILEFYQAYPEDGRTPGLLVRRWTAMYNARTATPDIVKEIDGVAKATKAEPMLAAADFARALVSMDDPKFDVLKAIQDFRAAHKGSVYYEQILNRATFTTTGDAHLKIVKMFLEDFPEHRFAKMLKGQVRQAESVGKPFELAFTDAISAKKIDIKDLKGKVVMIDWWATWCGPCVAELPHVKEVYKKYKDQGFEIIGVSLDYPESQGGLKKLKDFVKANDMTWPQYYMGNAWDSEFSSSWGIMSIPAVFLIDKQGNLREVEVPKLEESVKKLLKE